MFLPKLILDKMGLIQSSVHGTEGVALYDIRRRRKKPIPEDKELI